MGGHWTLKGYLLAPLTIDLALEGTTNPEGPYRPTQTQWCLVNAREEQINGAFSGAVDPYIMP